MSLIETARIENGFARQILDWIKARIDSWAEQNRRYRQQRIDRLAFETLLRLDDTTLRDIGYSREGVKRGRRMPIEVNAALELQEEKAAALRRDRFPNRAHRHHPVPPARF